MVNAFAEVMNGSDEVANEPIGEANGFGEVGLAG